MSTLDVQVQTDYVVFDDEGHQLLPTGIYTVKDGTLVQEQIADGSLTVVQAAPQPAPVEEEAPKEELKKTAPNKNRTQDTESN